MQQYLDLRQLVEETAQYWRIFLTFSIISCVYTIVVRIFVMFFSLVADHYHHSVFLSRLCYLLPPYFKAFAVWLYTFGLRADQARGRDIVVQINFYIDLFLILVISSGLLLYSIASLNSLATVRVAEAVVLNKSFSGQQRAALIQQMLVSPATLDICSFAVTNATLAGFAVSAVSVFTPLLIRAVFT
jgi:hypothetical protein